MKRQHKEWKRLFANHTRQLEDRSPVEFGPSLSAEHTSLFILIQETKKNPVS